MVVRTWKGAVRTEDADHYTEYVRRTGVDAYLTTPGNRGAWILRQDLPDGTTRLMTASAWGSMDDVVGFAGEDVSTSRFYPEDDRYLIDRDEQAEHWEVVDAPEG